VEIDYTPTRYNLFCFSSKDEHSVNTAIKAFKFLIFPLGVQEFFEHVYTKRAAIIRRADPDYNANLFSAQSFYEMFQQVCLNF
jgi:hypothetical protein